MDNSIALGLTTATHQPRTASAVVIGGGIIGVSVAWHLAKSGVRNVVVVERAEFGGGSSAKPLGGVRTNFSDSSNIWLGQRSLESYVRFEEEFGVDIGLKQVGYLFLGRTDEELSDMHDAVQIQNEMGLDSRMLTPDEAHRLNPFIDPSSLTGASYSPQDGFARPAHVVEGYIRAARNLGVTFLNRTQVLDIAASGGRTRSVGTNRGEIVTDAVFCCAGAWSAGVGAMVGVDLPVEPVRRLIGFTADYPTPPPVIPFTLDLSSTLYFHNAGDGILLGISHQEEPGFSREFSYEWLSEFRGAAKNCCPSLSEAEVVEGWAGLYENTPDRNALVGQVDDLSGFFYATGFSGHGFVQAPAVGELMADLYMGRPSFMTSAAFSHERFRDEGSLIHEKNII